MKRGMSTPVRAVAHCGGSGSVHTHHTHGLFRIRGRVGIWRLLELFESHEVKATLFTPGRICELYPKALADALPSRLRFASRAEYLEGLSWQPELVLASAVSSTNSEWAGFPLHLNRIFDFIALVLPLLLNSINLALHKCLRKSLFELKQAPSMTQGVKP
jgi:hypothetical protein